MAGDAGEAVFGVESGCFRREKCTKRLGAHPSHLRSAREPFWLCSILPESGRSGLERLYVGSLPALGTLYDVKLHGLTFLQTLESTAVDCGVMHENVFAVLARDKAEALRVIEPLHGTLFHTS